MSDLQNMNTAPPGGQLRIEARRQTAPSRNARGDARLREVAEQLEASFLAEMLKAAGLGKTRNAFGGGAGEDQFSSFLRDAQAQEMVKRGGIGLAQSLYEALRDRSDVE